MPLIEKFLEKRYRIISSDQFLSVYFSTIRPMLAFRRVVFYSARIITVSVCRDPYLFRCNPRRTLPHDSSCVK